jgi:hypothetical protein
MAITDRRQRCCERASRAFGADDYGVLTDGKVIGRVL